MCLGPDIIPGLYEGPMKYMTPALFGAATGGAGLLGQMGMSSLMSGAMNRAQQGEYMRQMQRQQQGQDQLNSAMMGYGGQPYQPTNEDWGNFYGGPQRIASYNPVNYNEYAGGYQPTDPTMSNIAGAQSILGQGQQPNASGPMLPIRIDRKNMYLLPKMTQPSQPAYNAPSQGMAGGLDMELTGTMDRNAPNKFYGKLV